MKPSERIGPYQVERELGRGGQALVLLALDTRLGRRVALKLLTGPAGTEAAARLHREARNTARVQHAGVARVHEVGEHEGRPFVAMDYVEGEPLAQHLERARRAGSVAVELPGVAPAHGTLVPALARSVGFVEQTARALHAAHEAGVIHRDLKPANLMVTPDGRPVILDFGLACEAGEGTGSMGTPAYMAPEQLDGGAERPDRRTDVFALGAILYECVTLRRAFEASSAQALGHAILSGAVPRARSVQRSVPRDLDTILGVALARRQDERYQTAQDLAEDLRRLRAGEPILARRAPFHTRVHRHVRRRPFVTLGWTAIVAALGIGTAFSLGQLSRNRTALSETRHWSDRRVLTVLEREAAAGWVRLPAAVPAMDAWLGQASLLGQRGRDDRASHAALPGSSEGTGESSELEAGLERLLETAGEVRLQREEAAGLVARTIDAYRERWDRAIAAIANVDLCSRYEGLRIAPQVGLVPLGIEPSCGLYVFHHAQTGTLDPIPPEGPWAVGPDTGLVFVLLPGGRFRMGAEPPGPERPLGAENVDPYATPDEGPVHEVELDPFFLSVYEMTRAQWLRLDGELEPKRREEADFRLPVSAPYDHAVEVLGCYGLALPTEAQWEYAARGGKTEVWWWGDSLDYLDDQEALVQTARAVGTHTRNPFGLYDMLGNSGEWVQDWFGSYELPVRKGDGLRLVEEGRWRMGRGITGSSQSNAPDSRNARCASRHSGWGGGVRPARVLDGEWQRSSR